MTGKLAIQFPNEEPYEVFHYQIIRLWEQPLAPFLSGSPGLLPLAPLTDEAATQLPYVLGKIDERLKQEVSLKQAKILRDATFALLGLRYGKTVIDHLAEGVNNMVLEESSIVQWALAKGEAKAEEKWRHAEAVEILLRLGTIKFGHPSSEIVDRIKSVIELSKLEEMAERLIRGNSWEELLP